MFSQFQAFINIAGQDENIDRPKNQSYNLDDEQILTMFHSEETFVKAERKHVSTKNNEDTQSDKEIFTGIDRKEHAYKSPSKNMLKNAGIDESYNEENSSRDNIKQNIYKTHNRSVMNVYGNNITYDAGKYFDWDEQDVARKVQNKNFSNNVNTDQFNDDNDDVSRLKRKEQLLEASITHDGNCSKSLPQAIVVGVMKGGTDTLATFLSLHPNIAMQKKVGAVQFFSKYYDKGLDWYKTQMPCSKPDQITMEKSPQYFTGKASERIYEMNSTIKLIIIVREPVSRMISHYDQIQAANPWKIKSTLENVILKPNGEIDINSGIMALSLYAVHIKRWLEEFSLKQIYIVDGDNFREDPSVELNKIETFLGLPHFITKENFKFDEEKGFYCLKTTQGVNCMPKGKGRKHKELHPDLIDKLKKFFKPHNEEFFKIIQKRFNWGY